MHYEFYGNHEVTNYYPHYGYAYSFGYGKVSSLQERVETARQEVFYENYNIARIIERGETVSLLGESLYINNVIYDIERDLYKVYTNKQLSLGDGNMTRNEAYRQVMELVEEEKLKSFWYRLSKRLFG